ncbi:MAG: hypothetical protein AVDCRST_MAG20-1244, partial [uncultured Acidimicrobiales bacterium]
WPPAPVRPSGRQDGRMAGGDRRRPGRCSTRCSSSTSAA